jgi:hypothetical protein
VFRLQISTRPLRHPRSIVVAGVALLFGLALALFAESVPVARAAQACSTLASGQTYCLTKSDAVDPIRVGEPQIFTIVESITAGTTQLSDPGALTDVVPANYAITSVAATLVGNATQPACTLSGNTVTCPGPRTLGPGAGQIIVTVLAVPITPSTNKKCDAVNNTASSSIPGVANQVSEPTTILPEKGPQQCGRKSTRNVDDDDKKQQLTKEQKQNRSRTDNSNRAQVKTEGNVVGVRCKGSDSLPTLKRGFISKPDEAPYALIGTRDGVQQIILTDDAKSDCKKIETGDYLKAEGEKEHEQLFIADEIEIKRDGDWID